MEKLCTQSKSQTRSCNYLNSSHKAFNSTRRENNARRKTNLDLTQRSASDDHLEVSETAKKRISSHTTANAWSSGFLKLFVWKGKLFQFQAATALSLQGDSEGKGAVLFIPPKANGEQRYNFHS